MFTDGQLRHCHEQKAALIRESAANREAFTRNAESFHRLAAWIDLGIRAAGKVRAGWKMLSPVLSLWHRRKQ